MEHEKYIALLTVLDCSSISGAAKKLGYTTSGISRMIQSLEDENGFLLLHRSRDGITATKECEALLPEIRSFVRSGEILRQKAGALTGTETGRVRIGTAYSAFYEALSSLTKAFSTEHPGIQVEFMTGFSTDLAERIRGGELDMAIISRRGELPWVQLLRDPMVAAVPANLQKADVNTVPHTVFTDEPYIEIYPGEDSDNRRFLKKYGITPDVRFTTTDSLAGCAMVNAGLGTALNNRLNVLLWNGNHRILMLDPPEYVDIGIAASGELSPAAEIYLEYLKAHKERLTEVC